jgi:predicted pyridoxine 5'-phosphate oxidase superfamily flavin-nucleotide-binding protein
MSMYHEGNREMQDRFDTRRLADRLEEVKVHDAFTADDRAFIERLEMFFMATTDAAGQPTCSYKGGPPGFVRVTDERTLLFPSYDGNGMFLTLGNVRQSARVGLLFVDFEGQRRIRVNGTAVVSFDDEAMAWYPEAQLIVRVTPTQIFPNCPRYIHKMALVERSRFVPEAGRETPTPAWKESAWAKDVLPGRNV